MTRWFIIRLTLLVLLTTTVSACASEFIRDEDVYTDDAEFIIDDEARIPDTVEHRAVLDVMASYRSALVKKDFGTLNRLVADDYYDNGSTTNTTVDDYGRDQLAEVFEMLANHAESIQYRVTVKSVEIDRDEALIDYEYRYSYQYRVADEVSWDAGVEVNRVTLRRRGSDWLIVSGL